MSELAQLMEEPAGGPNNGRRASDNPNAEGRHLPLGVSEWQARDMLQAKGWGVIHAKDGAREGIHAHRGVLHEDEYVDTEALRPALEAELGFTVDEVRSVYARKAKGGPLPHSLRELRGRIDARVLALSRSGGNLLLLARVLGLSVKPGDDKGGPSCDSIERAMARARREEKS
jgi:hypothetical protein